MFPEVQSWSQGSYLTPSKLVWLLSDARCALVAQASAGDALQAAQSRLEAALARLGNPHAAAAAAAAVPAGAGALWAEGGGVVMLPADSLDAVGRCVDCKEQLTLHFCI